MLENIEFPIFVMTWLDMVVRVIVRLMNFGLFLFSSRTGNNFRYAETFRDAFSFAGELAGKQFVRIYGRRTAKYNYHPLQRFQNSIRKFDLGDSLAAAVQSTGTAAFYATVCGHTDFSGRADNLPDLTRVSTMSTIKASADYLYNDLLKNDEENTSVATKARDAYARGFSRIIKAADYDDWEAFRKELRKGEPSKTTAESVDEGVLLIALSYKGKTTKITRRMKLVEEDGSPAEEWIEAVIEEEMTGDFLDDFRWSQVVRSCRAIASSEEKTKVRLWIDRYVLMEYETLKERTEFYEDVAWEDFGLFPYAVCPVVRVYDAMEPNYGTDFWRKLETILGVAGRGLVVDDYMLRKYDRTLFFGPQVYKRLDDGLSRVGGNGKYVRATTLALATALLTDGVSVREANEDPRTKAAAGDWKAWALRTISEGAYSDMHRSMMCRENAFTVNLQDFKTLVFWESIVSKSEALVGKSYLDMSLQRSTSWRKAPGWDGILEWVGMLESSCTIKERELILELLSRTVSLEMYAAPSGHVAGMMTMTSDNGNHKKTLVVDLARFSTGKRGHVTAVAEATGLWGGKVLPMYLRHIPNPDADQKAALNLDGGGTVFHHIPMKPAMDLDGSGTVFHHIPMKIEFVGSRELRIIILIMIVVGSIILIEKSEDPPRGVYAAYFIIFIFVACVATCFLRFWPWVDAQDIGEAVFDNLLMHALFLSGIKKDFRKLRTDHIQYNQLGWS